MSTTKKQPDQELVGQLAAQIASINPCCTSAEIMEIVAKELEKQKIAERDGTFQKAIDISDLPGGLCDG